jgi:hypothetical protein
LSLFLCSSGHSRETRQHMLPNALKFADAEGKACILCHTNPSGDSPRNSFGTDVDTLVEGSSITSRKFWWTELAHKDSDHDGYTNGQELQDPDGILLQQKFGLPIDEGFPKILPTPALDELTVGNLDLVSNPADPDSTPPAEPTATETSPGALDTPTPSLTETPVPSPTTSPTDTATVTATLSSTSEPTPTHTLTQTVTTTATYTNPAETNTPTVTNFFSESPTPTETAMSFNRDADPMITGKDLVVLLSEGLSSDNWLMMSYYWQRPQH